MSIRNLLAEYNLKQGQIPIGYVMDSIAIFDNYIGEGYIWTETKLAGLYNIPDYGILYFNGKKWIEPDHVIWGEE